MYAVIRTGGKQCRVKQGEIVRVEALAVEAGDTVTFDEVLLVGEGESVRVGSPTVDGASVQGTVLRQGRQKKVVIQTYKRRQNSNRRRAGHRQAFTEVKIDAIEG
jgi:large subunit ribosomal protein L21